jgi:glycosyltransferase involved in cell wall biosynthesis
MPSTYSVVIPARNAERTLRAVLARLEAEDPPLSAVIVVDDASDDGTAVIAASAGAEVVSLTESRSAGGARNAGWERAGGDYVVFLDSDAIPNPGWARGLSQSLDAFPGAIIGCAHTFAPATAWGWVAHLQVETPYLPGGEPRAVPFVPSYCIAVPIDVPWRWDESYGGEDALFCVRALEEGYELIFDPRFSALHDHGRASFPALRSQQRRLAYGLARWGRVSPEGTVRRIAARLPLHFFALVRLVSIWRRVRGTSALRRQFIRHLPLLVVAEWTLGASALRYAARRFVT